MISVKLLYSIIFFVFYITITEAWEPLEIVEFEKWATDTAIYISKVKMPSLPKFVMLSQTITNECFSKEECRLQLNSEEMSRIIPHFYVGSDGRIYTGHGWDLMGPESLCDVNVHKPMIEIVFIGDFENSKFPNKQLRAAQKLLEYGVLTGKLSKFYELFGEWQIIDELAPMYENSAEIFKAWPHWTANLKNCLKEFENSIPLDEN